MNSIESDTVIPVTSIEQAQTAPSASAIPPEALLKQMSAEKASFPVFNGIIGALLGSIPGIILWVVIGQLGFIAGICGWLMIRGAIFGYQKLAGGIDKRGSVIATIIALLMPIAGEYLGLAVSVYRTFHEEYAVTVGEALSSVPLYLSQADIVEDIIFSLLIGYVLIILGNVRINPGKKNAAQTSIPKL